MDPTIEGKLKGFSTQVSGSYLSLALTPPATAEDNTSHDLQAPDEVSTNMVSRPIAPRSYSREPYWCEGCKKLTTTSQWHLGPTNIRDLCNKHYQKSLRERKKAAKRACY